MSGRLRTYQQMEPYLTEEAKALISLYTEIGFDPDLAMQIAETKLTVDKTYEILEDGE